MACDGLPGEQPGHGHAAAEEMVRHGGHARGRPRNRGDETLEARRVQRSADQSYCAGLARRAPATQGARNAVLEAPDEADTVLRDGESLVRVGLGQRHPRLQIHLVADDDETAPETLDE